MLGRRDNQFTASVRKAEVRNCNETRAMQKSIDQCYKQHQKNIKEIEKEQSQLVKKSKLFRSVSNSTSNSSTLREQHNTDKSSPKVSKKLNELSKVKSSHSSTSLLEHKTEKYLQLPTFHIQSEVNINLLNFLASPNATRKRYPELLNKSLSRSLGNLDSLSQRMPHLQTNKKLGRHLSLATTQDVSSFKLPSCSERLANPRLTHSASCEFDFEDKQNALLERIGEELLGSGHLKIPQIDKESINSSPAMQRQRGNQI